MRWVFEELDVRYVECDPMGVAHHSHYFVWFEVGRIAWSKASGLDALLKKRELSILFPVVNCEGSFCASAKFGDRIIIGTALKPVKAARFEFIYRIKRVRARRLLAEGSSSHVLLTENQEVLWHIPIDIKYTIDCFLQG